MKVLINEYDNPKLSERVFVSEGDWVYATEGAVGYGFTKNEKYLIEDINVFGFLNIMNDDGFYDYYSREYFSHCERI